MRECLITAAIFAMLLVLGGAIYWLLPDCIPMIGGGCSFTLGTMG